MAMWSGKFWRRRRRPSYQVFADQRTALELRALTVGQAYSFAIEAFNENGVSSVSSVVRIPAAF